MKTSYFDRSSNHPNAVSIAGLAPAWYKGKQYKKLAPKELVKVALTTKLSGTSKFKDETTGEFFFWYGSYEYTMEFKGNSTEDFILRSYYSNGNLRWTAPFKNKKKNGLLKRFYANGNLAATEPYLDDLVDGVVYEYYEDCPDTLWVTTDFVNGKVHGNSLEYSPGGDIIFAGTYEDGKRIV